MPDEEEIDIRAKFHDEVSRPATTAAKAVDHLGDESRETAGELAMMGEAADKAGEDIDDLGVEAEKTAKRLERQRAAARRTELELKGLRYEAEKNTEEQKELGEEVKKTDGFFQRLFRTLRRGDGTTKRTARGFKFLSKILKFGLFSLKWIAIATGISFVATALKGLGAAGYAAVAGLAPLTGMLVAYPGLLGALMQAIGTTTIAMGGMGDLIKTLGDPKATGEEIQAALAGMHQEQVLFARAVVDSRKEWKGLKKEIGGRFFKDLDQVYRDLSENYLPIADKYLGQTADSMNRIITDLGDWLNSERGQKTISDIMQDNVYIIDDMGHGLFNVGRIIAGLTRAAGPMLREMSFDFRRWTDDLATNTETSQGKLERFFNRSYDLFQKTVEVTGSYMRGLYNIGKQSRSLSRFMGTSLEEIGQDFESWTESREGKRDIRKFFRDMIPIVKELGYWIRDLAKFLGDITMNNDDFVTASKALREQGLPALAAVINMLSSKVVPTLEWMGDVYEDLKESGAVGGTMTALRGFGRAIEWTADKLADLPTEWKGVLAFATTVAASYGILKKTGIIGKGASLLGAITGKGATKGWGVQKVYVVNWAQMSGGGGPGGVVGGPGGGKKPGKIGRFARGAAKSFLPLYIGFEASRYVHNKADNDIGRTSTGRARTGGMEDAGYGAYPPGGYKSVLDRDKEAVDRLTPSLDTLSDKLKMTSGHSKLLENAIRRKSKLMPEAAHNTKLFGDRWDGVSQRLFTVEDALGDVKGAIDRVPNNKSTSFSTPGLDSALSRATNLANALANMPNDKDIRINLATAYSGSGWQNLGGLQERWTGGMTEAGKKYLTGELGPEAWVSRSGGMKMLGLHGPEVASPGSGAVVPASATQDPFGGATGLAPGWAVERLREAVSDAGMGARKRETPRNRDTGPQTPFNLPPVQVYAYGTGLTEDELAESVRKGIEKAQQDAEERQ